MKVPSNVYASCPLCEDETMNHVLRGSFSSRKRPHIDAVVECLECKHVYHTQIELEQKIKLPLVLSKGDRSKKTSLLVPEDEMISVGDEVIVEGKRVQVTAIEHGSQRATTLPADKISTLWGKYYEKIPVKVSIVDKGTTFSRKIWAAPEEEFEIGDIIELAGVSSVVYAIKTTEKKLRKGFTRAENILRIYTKPMRGVHRYRGR